MDYNPDEPMTLAPFRNWGDFAAESARFQLPAFNDSRRLASRILSNLLYYQTNYFLLFFAVFTLSWCFKPKEVGLGCLCVVVAGVFLWYLATNPGVVKFREEHPLVFILVVLSSCLLIARLAGFILTFVSAFVLPISIILVHAATRLRNLKNKFANKLEKFGLNKPTPMAFILQCFSKERRFGEFFRDD